MSIRARNFLRLAVLSVAIACLPLTSADKGNLDGFDDFMAKAMTEFKVPGAAVAVVKDGKIVGGPDNGKPYAGTLIGTTGNNVIVGTEGNDTVDAKAGNDTICGLGGDDKLGEFNRKMTILDLASFLASKLELASLIQDIVFKISEVMDADRTTLFIADRQRQELWSKVAQGLETREIRLPMGTGIVGQVYSTGESQVIDAVRDDPHGHPGATHVEGRPGGVRPKDAVSGRDLGPDVRHRVAGRDGSPEVLDVGLRGAVAAFIVGLRVDHEALRARLHRLRANLRLVGRHLSVHELPRAHVEPALLEAA